MSNNDQFQFYLYHPYLNQPHRYTRQIIYINEKTTCEEILGRYVSDSNTARLIETCFEFEREIPLDDCLFNVITRNRSIEEFKIIVRHIHDNHHSQYHQRRRITMRSPLVNNNHQSSHEFISNQYQTNINQSNVNNQLVNYSLSELQEITVHQQEQIEQNKQLLLAREQHLQYLKQQQTIQQNLRFKHHIEQQEIKHLRLKTLQNQINQQKNSNSTIEDELEVLKQIFLNKEQELTIILNKVDELTKQLDQLRKLKTTTNQEQSQNKNELDKLQQELMIRNKLNEQQNRKITYQREIITLKQAELNQLDRRIEELQKRLKMKTTSHPTKSTFVDTFTSSNGFKTVLDTVQNTLNNINIAEIEKRMVQLANSFNLINTNGSSFASQNDQINNSNSPKKTNDGSSSIPPAKIAFASKSEIAAAYMAGSLTTSTSSPLQSTNLPILLNKSTIDMIDSLPSKTEEQLLPPNLRLNDDILSIHFNNITSNIKKRHSLSDASDSLIKYLSSNLEQQPIHVRDDSLINSSLSGTQSTIAAYENLFDLQTNINNDDSDVEQQQTIIESVSSDTQSEGSLSDDIESTISFSTNITTSIINLKSLLKTSTTPKNTTRRVIFDPLALLLDAAIIGELELLIKSAKEVKNPSQPNDEGLTALHNAVCASNFECVKFLVEFGCDINYADNDGWTPLHCAASCNNTLIVAFLIEHGACIYATTIRDNETAAEKCEEEEENYTSCSQYLLNVQNDLGVINNGLIYALYDYEPNSSIDNELEFKDGDSLTVLRRGDENEKEWWWAKHENTGKEGYIPRNYLGLYPRVRPGTMASTNY
ncbi:unnamed protein product [Rotaria sordida]|uniref:SH3 domain-containing protein n=1 Tax=Rotaria sordida TaxID=392033 RepID=A0A813QM16_9BILA|nr:unnamed protein product [Rotaria sordida]CAF0768803.1 unnamed protein product [Rotaria sordida]